MVRECTCISHVPVLCRGARPMNLGGVKDHSIPKMGNGRHRDGCYDTNWTCGLLHNLRERAVVGVAFLARSVESSLSR